jgi:hypothetical protein
VETTPIKFLVESEDSSWSLRGWWNGAEDAAVPHAMTTLFASVPIDASVLEAIRRGDIDGGMVYTHGQQSAEYKAQYKDAPAQGHGDIDSGDTLATLVVLARVRACNEEGWGDWSADHEAVDLGLLLPPPPPTALVMCHSAELWREDSEEQYEEGKDEEREDEEREDSGEEGSVVLSSAGGASFVIINDGDEEAEDGADSSQGTKQYVCWRSVEQENQAAVSKHAATGSGAQSSSISAADLLPNRRKEHAVIQYEAQIRLVARRNDHAVHHVMQQHPTQHQQEEDEARAWVSASCSGFQTKMVFTLCVSDGGSGRHNGASGAEAQCCFDSLVSGAFYCARVRAASVAGWGSWAYSKPAPARAPPTAPLQFKVTAAGGAGVHCVWSPPVDTHGADVKHYELQYRRGDHGGGSGGGDDSDDMWRRLRVPGGHSARGVFVRSSTRTSPGHLRLHEHDHEFRLRAVNQIGGGAFAAPVSTAASAPPPAARAGAMGGLDGAIERVLAETNAHALAHTAAALTHAQTLLAHDPSPAPAALYGGSNYFGGSVDLGGDARHADDTLLQDDPDPERLLALHTADPFTTMSMPRFPSAMSPFSAARTPAADAAIQQAKASAKAAHILELERARREAHCQRVNDLSRRNQQFKDEDEAAAMRMRNARFGPEHALRAAHTAARAAADVAAVEAKRQASREPPWRKAHNAAAEQQRRDQEKEAQGYAMGQQQRAAEESERRQFYAPEQQRIDESERQLYAAGRAQAEKEPQQRRPRFAWMSSANTSGANSKGGRSHDEGMLGGGANRSRPRSPGDSIDSSNSSRSSYNIYGGNSRVDSSPVGDAELNFSNFPTDWETALLHESLRAQSTPRE